ncbi:MAG: UDP-galactopyranose mutase [Paludibacteraceae bacterium]|nr:UDP-galactopyranose mutase [Paludibacteraceae bacterium]
MKTYDYLIVGSGLFGATFAYQMTQAGKRCLVIDRRAHLGGNVYCENIEGINVHKYGAHIFHTSDKQVWTFVNSLVEFNRYTNSPVANYKGELFNLPFNMNTFSKMWGVSTPREAQEIIEQQRREARQKLELAGATQPRNLEEQALLLVGNDIYQKLIKGYTEKQWGRSCDQLPSFIIKRLPVRFVFDNNYFNDKYQGIPIGGYNQLIKQLLAKCDIRLETDYLEHRGELDSLAQKTLYTGAIDAFYDYQYGKLEYRTVSFENEVLDIPNYQGNAVVNYTDRETPYTRIIEHKHFEMFGAEVDACPKTVISKEYSKEWEEGMEPYYPVNDERNTSLYQKYENLAQKETKVLFGGRLAEYKYYDMAPTVQNALHLADREVIL